MREGSIRLQFRNPLLDLAALRQRPPAFQPAESPPSFKAMFLGQGDSRLGELARRFGFAPQATQCCSMCVRPTQVEGVLEFAGPPERLVDELERFICSAQRELDASIEQGGEDP